MRCDSTMYACVHTSGVVVVSVRGNNDDTRYSWLHDNERVSTAKHSARRSDVS